MHRLISEDYAVDAVTAAKALVGARLCRRLEDGSVVRWQKGSDPSVYVLLFLGPGPTQQRFVVPHIEVRHFVSVLTRNSTLVKDLSALLRHSRKKDECKRTQEMVSHET